MVAAAPQGRGALIERKAMTEREAVTASGARCQARPAAARHGWREDVLCASNANTSVSFRGVHVPVCRMHEAAFARWGSEAEAKAASLWAWSADPSLALLE
jgi:hypothetical protein